MGKRILVIGTMLGLCLAGCEQRQAEPDVAGMLRAAGERAPLTLVLRPLRWRQARLTLRPLLASVREPTVQALVAAPDLAGAVRALLAAGPLPLALPDPLPGFDPLRPVVAALFEPQAGALLWLVGSLPPFGAVELPPEGLPGIRHRLLLPASAPRTLAAALAPVIEQLGYHPWPASTAPERDGQMALFLAPDGTGCVLLVAEAERVRVEILIGERRSGLDRSRQAAAWQALLAAPPAPARPTDSPAFRLVTTGAHLAAVYLRPWQIRDLAGQQNALDLFATPSGPDRGPREEMLTRGLADLARGYLLMSPRGAELEDVALAFDLEHGLRTTAVATLSRHGQAAVRAGLESGRSPLEPAGPRPLAFFWSRLDLDALLATAGIPPALAGFDDPQQMLGALEQSGEPALLYLLLRTPFGLARSLLEAAAPGATGRLPRAVSLVLWSLVRDRSAWTVQAAAALRFRPDVDPGPIEKAGLELAGDLPGPGPLRVWKETEEGDPVVLLASGLDPRPRLKGRVDAPDVVLGQGRLDLAALAAALDLPGRLAPAAPAAAALVGRLGEWRTRWLQEDRALVGESLIELAGHPPLAWTDPDAYRVERFRSAVPRQRPGI